MQRNIASLDPVRIYFEDAITFNRTPSLHVQSIQVFLGSFEEHNMELASGKETFGDTRIAFLGHLTSSTGLTPDPGRAKALTRTPMPSDVSQPLPFLCGFSYDGTFLPTLVKRLRPLTDLLKQSPL